MGLRGPFFILRGKLLHQGLVFGSQVVLFRSIPDVVYLPGATIGGYQLEFARHGGAVPLVFPEDGARRAGMGNVVPYLVRRYLGGFGPVGVEGFSVHVGGHRQFGPGEAGGSYVLEQEGGMVARSGPYAFGIADDEGSGKSSVKGFDFVLAVGGVGDGCPHGAVAVPAADFSQWADGEDGFFIFVVLRHFRGRPVIREEHDDRVSTETVTVQGFQDTADALVHDGDLSRINGHAPGEVVFALGRRLFIPGRMEFFCHAQLGGRRHDTQKFLIFQPFGGDGGGRFALIHGQHLFYVLPGSLERSMWRGIGHVQEEGPFAFGGIVNVGQGRSGDVVRHVEVCGQVFRLEQFAVFPERTVRHWLVIIRRSSQKAAVAVETPVPRVGAFHLAQMPFSGKIGAVAGFFQ